MEEDGEDGANIEEDNEAVSASTICNARRGVKDTGSFSIIIGFYRLVSVGGRINLFLSRETIRIERILGSESEKIYIYEQLVGHGGKPCPTSRATSNNEQQPITNFSNGKQAIFEFNRNNKHLP